MALSKPLLLVGLGILVMVSGCATAPTMYTWKDYDDRLYKYYQSPTEPESFIKDLKEVIAEGEIGNNVPPGSICRAWICVVRARKLRGIHPIFPKRI